MTSIKKCLSIALVLLMTLSVSIGLAEDKPTIESAIAAGREVSYSASAKWHGLPELDEKANQTIASLLDSIQISGKYTLTGEMSGYDHFEMGINDQQMLYVNSVVEDNISYIDSSMFGKPYAMKLEDLPKYFENLGIWFNKQIAKSNPELADITAEDIYDSIGQAMMEENPNLSPEAISSMVAGFEALMNDPSMEAISVAIEEWLKASTAGEPFEEEITSVLGGNTQKATVYQITKEELVSFFQDIIPMYTESDAYMQYVIDIVNMSLAPEEQLALADEMSEEIKAGLNAMIPDLVAAIPDDLTAQYIECYDDAGANTLGIIKFMLDIGETEPFTAYVEWIPNETACTAYIGSSEGNFQFLLEALPEESLQLDGQPAVQKGFKATISMQENTTEIGRVEVTKTTQESEVANASKLSISIGDNEMKVGIDLDAKQNFVYDGPDIAIDGIYDVSYFVGDTTEKILTLNVAAATGEPSGKPFDPKSGTMEFLYPAQMDEAAFADWIENDLMVGAMQSILKILSALPQDAFAQIMEPAFTFDVDVK